MTKIGIIRCQEQSNDCAGWGCFPALRNKTGSFSNYDELELVGFDTCGGCGRNKADKIVSRAKRMKEKGAEAIHLGVCLVHACPAKEVYRKAIEDKVNIPVIEGTHPIHK